jgi:hypothetical protein
LILTSLVSWKPLKSNAPWKLWEWTWVLRFEMHVLNCNWSEWSVYPAVSSSSVMSNKDGGKWSIISLWSNKALQQAPPFILLHELHNPVLPPYRHRYCNVQLYITNKLMKPPLHPFLLFISDLHDI